MSLNAKKIKAPKGKSNQELLPVGMHPARTVQIIDLGLQARKPWKGKEKPPVNQVWVTYELTNQFMKDDKGEDDLEKPRWISERMNLFPLDQENATSTKRINALDPAGELEGDWTKATDIPCLVQVVHSKDGKYANIGSVNPPMAGMDTPALVNDPVVFELDNPDMEVYEALPDFLKEIITGNIEFKGSVLEARLNGKEEPVQQEEAFEEDKDEEDIY